MTPPGPLAAPLTHALTAELVAAGGDEEGQPQQQQGKSKAAGEGGGATTVQQCGPSCRRPLLCTMCAVLLASALVGYLYYTEVVEPEEHDNDPGCYEAGGLTCAQVLRPIAPLVDWPGREGCRSELDPTSPSAVGCCAAGPPAARPAASVPDGTLRATGTQLLTAPPPAAAAAASQITVCPNYTQYRVRVGAGGRETVVIVPRGPPPQRGWPYVVYLSFTLSKTGKWEGYDRPRLHKPEASVQEAEEEAEEGEEQEEQEQEQ